jgi:glycosyltransferase involved in cell wall biosynthesis
MAALRVILTVNYSPWARYAGGGQRSTHQLGRALAELGHHVTVVYTRAPFDTWRAPEGLPYRVVYATFVALVSRGKSPLRPLNAVTVRRAVTELAGRGSVVHCQGEEGALLPEPARRHGFALIATPRYPAYPAPLFGESRWRRKLVAPKFWALEALLAGADRVVPTSKATALEVQRAFAVPAERLAVVPNGIAEEFQRTERRSGEAGPIVFFGRLEHEKGVDTLIEAYARLPAPKPELVIAGRGSSEAQLRELAERLRCGVEFVGWRDTAALATLLSGARLAVLPSREESFGNAMAEAMACGVPLISTRVGSIPEVTGDAACLVESNAVEALRAAMERLLSSTAEADRLGALGRTRMLESYSWASTARRFEALYRDVLSERAL